MKGELQEIKPGVGLGKIKFGMSRDQIKKMLGEPDDVDAYSFSGANEDLSESWHYDKLEISMSFDEEDDWRLITLAVSSDYYHLNGKPLIGMDQDTLLEELEDMNFDEVEEEEGAGLDMPDHDLVSLPSEFMNFWLENGMVTEIQWSPRFSEDDEVEWPE